ncbi:MAG: zinc ribbon domain-containing protein [Methanobrevibacter sp.]|uniref:zinc ribbon domain-containing protein n=1 Tax=uncultured Methanobrevibacter sp. TaxID=253161 RepID=UPI0025FCF091|nr:zinc ribbon domain-containing protein [uncultured Methanobrevibacter sp.]MEE1129020.1 zinc ribbon domain-containing protein [Methanobrevibacter sp.]
MKKCPECGNPSYDGAPVCGNCGYKFPKPKVIVPKEESIFEKQPKPKKPSSGESTVNILKEKKLIIGAIVLITLIVICGIVLTGPHNNNNTSLTNNNLVKVSEGAFSFEYPSNWEVINGSDADHTNAKFFKNTNNTIIEYYNSTMESTSLKEITQDRISYAQNNDSYVELVETITLDGRNASNVILENNDGNYTRFVSMFSDGKLYVFKISGESINSVTSEDITAMINTADIT